MSEPIDIDRIRRVWCNPVPHHSGALIYERTYHAIAALCDEVERLRARVAELEATKSGYTEAK